MKIIMSLLLLVLSQSVFANVNDQVKTKTQSVSNLDLNSYLGKWYEIATIPQWFQKGCECVTAEYSFRKDSKIKVVNSCVKNGKFKAQVGKAKISKSGKSSELKVSFFGPFYGDYWVIDLDKDYRYAVVSNPEGSTFWILSRTPTMDEKEYVAIIDRASKQVDLSQLKKTDQIKCRAQVEK